MIKKTKKYHEIEIKFITEEGGYGAETKKELLENLENAVGNNDMGCLSCKDIEITVDGKKEVSSDSSKS